MFGVDRPETELGNAYDWSKDIKENKYKNVKSYQGVLNPYNEYLIDKQNEDMVRKLANAEYSFGSNINYEYQDPKTDRIVEGTPYFDDVHGYRGTFHYDKNGNPVISSSDLYDFGKDYTKGFNRFY